ncbi:MAG: FliH/SctL family protein [Rhizomicrobium sp.]|jgi:flagellar assembly protein FliH
MTATKFTFDTVFADRRDVVSDAAKARQRRSLTEGEIDKLCADAHAEGMKAGEVRALEALEAAAREVTAAIDNALAKTSRYVEVIRAQSAEVAFAVARKVARAAVASFPNGEVEAALRDAMHQAIGEPRILLRAAPAIAEALAPHIAQIAHEEGYDGRVQMSPDPTIRGADCRVEWRGGGAERAEAAIDAALDELMARHFRNAEMRPTAEE